VQLAIHPKEFVVLVVRNAAINFGEYKDCFENVRNETCVIVQIETT